MKSDEEIDLVDLIKRLWEGRRMIAIVSAAAVVVGLAVALFSPVRYTAGAVIVPQSEEQLSGGALQGLAAIAGINVNAAQNELLPPAVYPMVAGSVPFQKELIYSAGLLPPSPDSVSGGAVTTITREENAWRKRLSRILSVKVDTKHNTIAIDATMPTAASAADIAARAQKQLERYITRFKVQKAQADLEFVEARYREVKAEFELRQNALAAFQDANRDISSAVARTRENSLKNEYELAFAIYSELARQREQAGIKVKEDTPIFTVVEPVTVPVERSAPRRALIMIISLCVGVFVGAIIAIFFPRVKIL
jgi:uncharacterized protein involved in exopolysaccharide biosynthesis